MKKLCITICSVILLSCNADDDFSISRNPFLTDIEPSVPKLVFPANNQECNNVDLEFDWNEAVDNDVASLKYKIDIAIEDAFSNIIFTATTSETTQTFSLTKGTVYYWRVKAIDKGGKESAYSTTQTFFTEPDAEQNIIPNLPEKVLPISGQLVTGNTTTLDWNASDNDNDPLQFDLYFGDTNPPALLEQDLSTTTFDVNIDPNTTYYWRIAVKDNKQGVTIGQVWRFTTGR